MLVSLNLRGRRQAGSYKAGQSRESAMLKDFVCSECRWNYMDKAFGPRVQIPN